MDATPPPHAHERRGKVDGDWSWNEAFFSKPS
jgi:hypothetical protein